MNDNTNTPDFIWDPAQILSDQAAYLVEEGQYDSEEAAFQAAAQDEGLLAWEWECLVDALTERLTEINPGGLWHTEVRNFGWRKLSGYKEFEAEDAGEFLREILPETDCTFRIYIHGQELEIQNFHHDSPCGEEWYTVLPLDRTEVAA